MKRKISGKNSSGCGSLLILLAVIVALEQFITNHPVVCIVILLLVCATIAAVIISKKQTSKKNVAQTINEPNEINVTAQDQLNRSDMLHKVYDSPIFNEHFENLEKIEMQYSVLYNLRQFFSPEMDSLISLCEHDIAILPQFKALHEKYNVRMPHTWDSFKRLSIIYERRKEYDKAIAVCKAAIDAGFIDDGSSGKMPGRLARLIRLSQKQKDGEQNNVGT